MARTPSMLPVWAPAFSGLLALVLCGLISSAGTAAAQDTWMLFQKDERTRRAAPPVREGSGLREGDRPLEPKGRGRDVAPSPRADGTRGYEAPPGKPTSAAPVEVERQELAPLPTPQPSPATAGATVPPSPQWEAQTAPKTRAPIPPPSRESGLASPPRAPALPSSLQRAPVPLPPRAVARPSLIGLASLAPKALEEIVEGLELPSKSATIATLWAELWRDAGSSVSPAFEAIRIETLRRSGAIGALKAVLDRVPPPTEPVLAIVVLRAHLLVGNREAGCALAGEAIRNRATLPAGFRRDAVLAAGYCALAGGNADAGRLTVDLIRGEGLEAPFALAVLEGAGAGAKAPPPLPPSVGTLDYRIGEAAGLVWPSELVDRAEPAVLAVIATAPAIDPGLKVAAAERAARLHVLPQQTLAEHYRGLPAAPGDLANPLATRQTGAMRRAVLMQAAEAEAAPDKKARLLAALLDDAGKAGLRAPVARLLGPVVEQMRPVPDVAWFADNATEILVHSGRGSAVENWADLGRDLDHWRVLGALASESAVPSSTGLASLERLARAGRIDPPRLHRVVTALDALDVQLPIPLWESASRTPQPTDGHLPPTGVLAELKMASDKGEGARVVLRVGQAMGPASAADANLLTLGDVMRALKNAGLTREARTLGIEALIDTWPTAAHR
jgi:hypothetical protein